MSGFTILDDVHEPEYRGLIVCTDSIRAHATFNTLVDYLRRAGIMHDEFLLTLSVKFPCGSQVRVVNIESIEDARRILGTRYDKIEFPGSGYGVGVREYIDASCLRVCQRDLADENRRACVGWQWRLAATSPRAAVLGDIYPDVDPVAAFHRKQALHEALAANREQKKLRLVEVFGRDGYYRAYPGQSQRASPYGSG